MKSDVTMQLRKFSDIPKANKTEYIQVTVPQYFMKYCMKDTSRIFRRKTSFYKMKSTQKIRQIDRMN